MDRLRDSFPWETETVSRLFPALWAEIIRLVEGESKEAAAPTTSEDKGAGGTESENSAIAGAAEESEESQSVPARRKESPGKDSLSTTKSPIPEEGTAPEAAPKERPAPTEGSEGPEPEKASTTTWSSAQTALPVTEEEIQAFIDRLLSGSITGSDDSRTETPKPVEEKALPGDSAEQKEELPLAELLREPNSPYYKGPPPPPRPKLEPPKNEEEARHRRAESEARLDRLTELMALTRPDIRACWNCGSYDHQLATCPQPRDHLFCYGCGRPGYTLRDCPLCEAEYRIFGRNRLPHPKK